MFGSIHKDGLQDAGKCSISLPGWELHGWLNFVIINQVFNL